MAPPRYDNQDHMCFTTTIGSRSTVFQRTVGTVEWKIILLKIPKHIARESVLVLREHPAHDRNPLAKELYPESISQWVAKKFSYKCMLMALREQPHIHEH